VFPYPCQQGHHLGLSVFCEIGSVACALVTTSIGTHVCISMPVCASDFLKAVCGVYRVLFSGLFMCGLFDGGGL